MQPAEARFGQDSLIGGTVEGQNVYGPCGLDVLGKLAAFYLVQMVSDWDQVYRGNRPPSRSGTYAQHASRRPG